jgi:hypothetical protein
MSQEILVSSVFFCAKNMFACTVILGFSLKVETYIISVDVMTTFLLVRVPAEKKPCLGSVPYASYLAFYC